MNQEIKQSGIINVIKQNTYLAAKVSPAGSARGIRIFLPMKF